jgi:uncharacterized RDD family membrane protein YckC
VLAVIVTTPVIVLDPANLIDNLLGEANARFGSIPTDGAPQWLFYITEHLGRGLGSALMVAVGGGLLLLMVRHTPRQILLLAMIALFFLAVNTRPNNFARYIVPLVPFLCIAAAYACRTAVGQVVGILTMQLRALALDGDNPLLRQLTRTAVLRRLTPAALIVGALFFSAESWANVARYIRLASAPDTRSAAQAWIEGHLPSGAAVAVEGGESYTRTSNLGPQIRPSVAYLQQTGPNSPQEAFFWDALRADAAARPPTYNLQIRDVGQVARRAAEQGNERVEIPVDSVDYWGRPDAFVLISWRSVYLQPGSTEPFWASLTANYTLAAEFPCAPCFPDDPYAWRMDYPTLAQIDPLAPPGTIWAGPGVRVFLRK